MFESAELGRKLDKAEYEARVPALRAQLLEAQFALQKTNTPLVVIIGGVEGSGKGELVNRLTEWLDVRGLEVHALLQASDEEDDRPFYWRYWRRLPPRGRITVFLGSWYTRNIVGRVDRTLKKAAFERELARIVRFERMLSEDGANIVKFWLHITKDEQRERFDRLESQKVTRWRVNERDWRFHRLYDRFATTSEQALRTTDTGFAPWNVIEAKDRRYAEVEVGQQLLARIQGAVTASKKEVPAVAPSEPASEGHFVTVLDRLSLNHRVERETYEAQIDDLQAQLGRLAWKAYKRRRSTVVVFEGWDAAGKGGAIRRISQALDARLRRVISIAAPTDEERAHHYLWRFWRHVPRAGRFTIYDRSWYGRVMVERVEGFATESEWRRAYREINEFEEQLTENDILVAKFFLHISPDEQARRFAEREQTPHKQHKITAEDWRNRGKWEAYLAAINEMVARTSTSHAPWSLVAADDKLGARLDVLQTLVTKLEQHLR